MNRTRTNIPFRQIRQKSFLQSKVVAKRNVTSAIWYAVVAIWKLFASIEMKIESKVLDGFTRFDTLSSRPTMWNLDNINT